MITLSQELQKSICASAAPDFPGTEKFFSPKWQITAFSIALLMPPGFVLGREVCIQGRDGRWRDSDTILPCSEPITTVVGFGDDVLPNTKRVLRRLT